MFLTEFFLYGIFQNPNKYVPGDEQNVLVRQNLFQGTPAGSFSKCLRGRIIPGDISTLLRIIPELENVEKLVKSKKS